MGPALVTTDEVADPGTLDIRLRLNGEVMQSSSTREFIFGVRALLLFLSATMTLEPGDVILTGTPPGVGFARRPPVYLKAGDLVEVEIGGLGVLSNPVVASGRV
jgi:2-keto-4-pentenoate hydratase/2-oxohepta-3-ene-1,7-dioic acid hydratase in catechol pathway